MGNFHAGRNRRIKSFGGKMNKEELRKKANEKIGEDLPLGVIDELFYRKVKDN